MKPKFIVKTYYKDELPASLFEVTSQGEVDQRVANATESGQVVKIEVFGLNATLTGRTTWTLETAP